jgi:hypothetical protein
MSKLIIDFETIGLEKTFAYDMGYVIAHNETNEVIHRKSYVITQIYNNKELFATGYYANKLPLYVERLKSGYSKKVSWGNAMRFLANDIKKYGVTEIYAYNSKFDAKVMAFMCEWFNVKNPTANFEFKDIMDYINPIISTENYKEFCKTNGFMTKHKRPQPQKKAETLYRYLTNNIDFVEEHTGLEDSLIELEILLTALAMLE